MTRPRIKFILVGVTRSLEDDFAKIIDGAIIGPETLEGLIKSYREGKIAGAPDVVHLITGRDMARYEDNTLDRSYEGVSNLGSVCTKYAVGLSEDTATTFLGAAVMAHELGHVLGARHDHPPKCPWSEGYLMSYLDGGAKKYRLSSCTVEDIRNTVKWTRLAAALRASSAGQVSEMLIADHQKWWFRRRIVTLHELRLLDTDRKPSASANAH
ncbi:A disintegrin and metalloproteinase with thrombospondin motifs like [Dermacentor andersoni]|uniref:A disintegrin and metalloproteinase with thrombospondin motifs like n=1 Tax=Dermacentor andersoni TaxID=34620 RepID=UPI003B3A302B